MRRLGTACVLLVLLGARNAATAPITLNFAFAPLTSSDPYWILPSSETLTVTFTLDSAQADICPGPTIIRAGSGAMTFMGNTVAVGGGLEARETPGCLADGPLPPPTTSELYHLRLFGNPFHYSHPQGPQMRQVPTEAILWFRGPYDGDSIPDPTKLVPQYIEFRSQLASIRGEPVLVPEPSTLPLLVSGVLALLATRRRTGVDLAARAVRPPA